MLIPPRQILRMGVATRFLLMRFFLLLPCSVTLAFSTVSCTQLREVPLLITLSDINQSNHVETVLRKSGWSKKDYRVTPQSSSTHVRFRRSVPSPEAEAQVRASMRAIKEEITRSYGYRANTLVFVFDNVTLRE